MPPLRNQDLFDAAEHPAQRADLARFEILLRFGGVYVDTDFEALAPIQARLEDVECFVARDVPPLGRHGDHGVDTRPPVHRPAGARGTPFDRREPG